jgi:L-gulono-1,4-lactone dehydrogenase
MWTNWSGGQRCAPAAVVRPGSRGEVAAALVDARAVRAVGAGHSFSGAVPTDGTLLHLDRLDRVLDADTASGLVRVEAGITLHRLSRELLARGLALPNLGDIDIQSLAGALATATHGTGGRLANLSSAVAAMELVLADGSERELTGGRLLRAARVGLGALGVVVAVTLRCVPAFRLHAVDEPRPLEDVLDSLEEHVEANEHFELFSFPHSPLALTRTNNRTDAPAAPPRRAREWTQEVLLDNHVFGLFNRIARRVPRTIPRLNRLAGAASSRRERVDHSFRVFASPRLVRFEEMEYALPRARAAEAVRACREILARHPVSFPIELRFSAGDDALLSPAHGRDTAYVAVHVFEGMDWQAPFREVEALMGDWGGRPHWGKRSFLAAADLAARYPSWEDFQAARAELDPGGRFVNPWIAHTLGARAEVPA